MALVTTDELCQMLIKEVPTVQCTVSPSGDQIAVEFKNRKDLVIHLLTPYYQNKLKSGGIPKEDIPPLIIEVKKLSERDIYSDTIIEDLNRYFGTDPQKL